jgi:quercetin 2,3-dioxygenase
MHNNLSAQIYLHDRRGISQTEHFRRFHTFNFDGFFDENRQPFGALQVLNDDTLGACAGLTMHITQNTHILTLPLVGGIEFKNNMGQHQFVPAGVAHLFSAAGGMQCEIINPYETALINFLQIWIKHTNNSPFLAETKEIPIPIQSYKNQLIAIIEGICYIGQYAGREEGTYIVKNSNNKVFIFVIKGAFEVQNRLLHARDGLSLDNVTEVEFEALSSNAIILLLEIA